MKKTKSLLLVFLVVLMVFAMSGGLFAADDSVTVSIYGYDKAYVHNMEVPMDTFDVSQYNTGTNPTFFTPLHAFIYALNNGTDLDVTDKNDFTCKNAYISTIDGLSEFDGGELSGWMYTINKVKPSQSVVQAHLKAGDEVVLYYSGGMTSPYAYFTPTAKTVVASNSATLNLKGNYGDLDITSLKNIAGISITINGEATEYKTDSSGNVTIPFAEAGEYLVGAASYTKSGDTLAVTMNFTAAKITVVEPVDGDDADLKSLALEALYPAKETVSALDPVYTADTTQYAMSVVATSSNHPIYLRYETENPDATVRVFIRRAGMAFETELSLTNSNLLQNFLVDGVNRLRIQVSAPEDAHVLDKNYYISITKSAVTAPSFTARVINPATGEIYSQTLKIAYTQGKPYPAAKNDTKLALGESFTTNYPGFNYDNRDAADPRLEGTSNTVTPIAGFLNTLLTADYNKKLNGAAYTFTDLMLLSLGTYVDGTGGSWEYAIDGVIQTEKEMGEVNSALLDGGIATLFWAPTGKTSCTISGGESRIDANTPSKFTVKTIEGTAVAGATLYLDGVATAAVTDANGEANLSIAVKGQHTVTAKKIASEADTLSCSSVYVKVGGATDLFSLEFKNTSGITKVLTPVFNPDTDTYTMTLNYDTANMLVKPVLADNNAMIYCYYTDAYGVPAYSQWAQNDYTGRIGSFTLNNYLYPFDGDTSQALNVGTNTCYLVVFSPDLQTKKTYTINVTREKSADPTLQTLSVAGVSSSTIVDENGVRFSATNTSRTYYCTASYDTTTAAITAKGKDLNVKINGDTNLKIGDNVFTINTISQDRKYSDKYTLVINRTPQVDITKAEIDPGYMLDTSIYGSSSLTFAVPRETLSFDITLEVTEGASYKIDNQFYFSGDTVALNFPVTANYLTYADNTIRKIVYIIKEIDGLTVTTSRVLTIHRLGEKGVIPDSVYGFEPAPGQFVGSAESPYAMLRNFINNDNLINYVSMGTFGGSATYYYEEPITNADTHDYGIDFILYGNAFPGNVEPGGVMVAQDKNNDGKPDTDEEGNELWYNLAGSSHYEDTTTWNYAVTYLDPKIFTGEDYLNGWYDNQGSNGTLRSDITILDYPSAVLGEYWGNDYSSGKLTLSGTLLTGTSNLDFGYFDVHSHTKNTGIYADSIIANGFDTPINPYVGLQYAYNASKGDSMDISWAVDEDGNPVQLDEISFIKCYNCIFEYRGSMGEASCELGGIIRTEETESVGTTEDLTSIAVQPTEGEAIAVPLTAGQYIYDIYEAPETFTLALGTDAENIYVNANRLASDVTTSQAFALKEDGTRIVRVIAQSGDAEAVIYLLRFTAEEEVHTAALRDLTLAADDGDISGFAFAVDTSAYQVTATAAATSVTVTPTAEAGNAITVNGQAVNSGESTSVALANSGDTTVSVVVTNGNAETTYTIVVKKASTVHTFIDTANHWAAESIDFVVSRNLFKGTSETTFSPDETMTRAMIVTVLYRMEGEPEAGTAAFNDINGNAYYVKALAWAAENGIITGTGNGKFEPNRAVTREEMVTMLYRYANLADVHTADSQVTPITGFGDYAKISQWALEAMEWAHEEGLIKGKTSQTLAPEATATRAEVATICQRYIEMSK